MADRDVVRRERYGYVIFVRLQALPGGQVQTPLGPGDREITATRKKCMPSKRRETALAGSTNQT
jgi:hypothetical protein